MRQAGRYMQEYRALRARYSMLDLIQTPELAAEITLQPIKAFDLDAAAVVCGHNHPSGNLSPSQDDIQITGKIKSACSVVDLSLHDHLIIAGGKWYSMADKGLI